MSAEVAVVIPLHQGARFVADAIASVRAQDVPVDLLVVDDGSTDGGGRIAQDLGARILRHDAARGVAAARNAGIAATTAPLVALLDQDDVWWHGKLAAQQEALAADPGLGLVRTRVVRELVPGVPAPTWWRAEWEGQALAGHLPSSWLVRRTALDRVGPFDERLRIADDLDWLRRAADAGVREHELPLPLVTWRVHDANGTHDVASSRREIMTALQASIRRRSEASR